MSDLKWEKEMRSRRVVWVEEGDKARKRGRQREVWAVSQLAVTQADRAQVVQLGASPSPESEGSRDRPASSPGEITLFKQMKCEH